MPRHSGQPAVRARSERMPNPEHAAGAGSRPSQVPFDLAAIERLPEWRDGVAWPVPYATCREVAVRQLVDFLALAAGLGDARLRDVLLLAGPYLMNTILTLTDTALSVAGERRSGVALLGGPVQADYLRGRAPLDPPPLHGLGNTKMAGGLLGHQPPRLSLLRRLKRIATWTSAPRLAPALLRPWATAVTVGGLLNEMARGAPGPVGFNFAGAYTRRAHAEANLRPRQAGLDELAEGVAEHMVEATGLQGETALRLHRLIGGEAASFLAKAARDLGALAGVRRLPSRLWSVGAGAYVIRALAFEVMRRGGEVTLFAHGGPAGLTSLHEVLSLLDLCAANRYVAPTEGVAELIRDSRALSCIAPCRRPEILGLDGDPQFRRVARRSPRAPARRPRVIYAPTIVRGHRAQHIPPLLPDAVYLDWQLRVAETIAAMPVDLLCKPHPGGALKGRPHPLADVAAVSYLPFESVMEEADVFIFDYPRSTTFWIALCSDRPVVLLDLGITGFDPRIEPLIAERCRILRVRFDACNRPVVDREALAEAISGGPRRADPGAFRRLLAGEG